MRDALEADRTEPAVTPHADHSRAGPGVKEPPHAPARAPADAPIGTSDHAARQRSRSEIFQHTRPLGGKPALMFKIGSINRRSWGDGSLLAAARHNKRTITGQNLDPALSHLNVHHLLGTPATPEGVAELAERLLAARGYRPPRADSTIAAEGIFSLAPETAQRFGGRLIPYFEDCAQWFAANLGGDLLCVDAHFDEDAPHVHAIVLLPLTEGGPSGSELIGYTHASATRLKDFHAKVAGRYGLRVPEPKLKGAAKRAAERHVHDHLRQSCDPALQSRIWPAVTDCIAREPGRFANELGIVVPTGPTLAQLARSSGHGPRTAAAEAASDRRLRDAAARKGHAPLTPANAEHSMGVAAFCGSEPPAESLCDEHPCSVGVASSCSSDAPSRPSSGAFTRDREDSLPSDAWDSDLGEFRRLPDACEASPAGAPRPAIGGLQ